MADEEQVVADSLELGTSETTVVYSESDSVANVDVTENHSESISSMKVVDNAADFLENDHNVQPESSNADQVQDTHAERSPDDDKTKGTLDNSQTENNLNNDNVKSSHNETQTKSTESDSEEIKLARQSRELKSILALSREAKLDTNIAHKRKSVELNKNKTDTHRSESPLGKRAMRSQNPEFVIKHQKFLSKVVSHGGSSPIENSEVEKPQIQKNPKKKSNPSESHTSNDDGQKIKMLKMLKVEPVKNKDVFCWRCHKTEVNVYCETCPRSYHIKCLKQSVNNPQRWVCPECVSIMKAESTKERSSSMKDLSLEQLCGLLKFALKRMMQVSGAEPFLHPVNEKEFPEYKNYIIQPMDLTKLEKGLKENIYGSTQAFEADAKWILHNSIIFNTAQAKLTIIAKNILKVCKQEMLEIENCASCYLNANTKRNSWFVEVCPKPHILVWAKLKGFPYWPAKAMRANSLGMVDVRFFGAHDRAWVPDKECFLYSLKDPNCNKQKKNDIAECIKELEIHIENLKKVYGEFCYAPYRTPFIPDEEIKQLKVFLPQYNPDSSTSSMSFSLTAKRKNSESPKSRITKREDSKEAHDLNNSKNFEGYGSEDDDMEPKLDADRREQIAKNSAKMMKSQESSPKQDDDHETQANTPDDIKRSSEMDASKPKKSESGITNVIGKNKTTPPKQIGDTSKKRTTTDEMVSETPMKKSRRNSDISVKSDSSRISNLSDKINRVDIAENMEITLGNDNETGIMSISEVVSSDVGTELSSSKYSDFSESSNGSSNSESKRKPIVQLNISGNENKEFTISPQNKISIADKLMQKFGHGSSDSERSAKSCKNDGDKINNNDLDVNNAVNKLSSKVNEASDVTKINKGDDASKHNNSGKLHSLVIETLPEFNLECAEVVVGDSKKPISNEKEDANDVKGDNNCISVDGKTKEDEIKSFLPEITKTVPQPADSGEGDDNEDSDDNNEQIEKMDEDIFKDVIHSSVNTFSIKNCEPSTKCKEKLINKSSGIKGPKRLVKVVRLKDLQNKSSSQEGKNVNGEQSTVTNREPRQNKKTTVTPLKQNENQHKQFESNEKKTLGKVLKENSQIEPSLVSDTVNNSKENKSPEENDQTQIEGESESITIKSEPSSSDEEVEDIEAKRKYMSALNISEKDKIIHEKKPKEIRTRSKTEERSKLMNLLRVQDNFEDMSAKTDKGKPKGNTTETIQRKTDNLSRTINDVASHYSVTHEKEAIQLPERKKLAPLRPFAAFQKQRSRKTILSSTATSQGVYITPRKSDSGNTVSSNSSIHLATSNKSLPIVSCSCLSSVGNTVTISKGNLTPTRSLLLPRAPSDNFTNTTSSVTTTTTTAGIVFLSQQPIINSLAIVPPNQQLNCGANVGSAPPMLTVVQPINSSVNPSSTSSSLYSNTCVTTASLRGNVNVQDSQNYIPPSGGVASNANVVVPVVLNDPKVSQILNSLPSLAPLSTNYFYTFAQKRGEIVSSATNTTTAASTTVTASNSVDAAASANNGVSSSAASVTVTNNGERGTEEWDVLTGIIPENLSQAVSDLVTKGVPKLKPRPPGPLSVQFDEGLPSTAGPVTAKVNSISHRLADYLRGMLVELLKDFGTVEGPESEILKLRLENEELRQRHAEEMLEIKKNISSILRDIQRSIVEERAKIIEETRAACEVETIKRIEEAKSKQWCANCFKEAQFYCCWNTSYCDYPCQQKHWLKHMSKCTQNQQHQQQQQQQLTQQAGNNPNHIRIPNQTIMLRSTNPINRYTAARANEKTLVAKPTKVYLNRGSFKPSPHGLIKTSTANGQQLTLVESSPGNYELLGNSSISVGGKIITNSTSIIHKVQKGNSTPNNMALSVVPTSSLIAVAPKLTTISTAQPKTSLSSTSSTNSSAKTHNLFSDDSD